MRIPWLFSRYLAKRFLLTFLAVLFVLSALILLFDVIDLLRRAASKEYVSFLDVVRLGLFKVPQTGQVNCKIFLQLGQIFVSSDTS